MNSNTRKAAQGQERQFDEPFSIERAVLIVMNHLDVRAAARFFGLKAFVFDWFLGKRLRRGTPISPLSSSPMPTLTSSPEL